MRLTFLLSFVLDTMLQKMGASRGKGQKSRESRSQEKLSSVSEFSLTMGEGSVKRE